MVKTSPFSRFGCLAESGLRRRLARPLTLMGPGVRIPQQPLYHRGLTGRAPGLQNREVQVRVLRMVLGVG